MVEGPRKFGRYFLLDLVAQGGMAEIYRARLAGADGAGRILVIKRIQAGYGTNAEFLSMFKSEIKVTMGFNHPNIVQLYDFGEESEQPYIAMEFVDGKNLRQFMTRFLELKQRFPVDIATHIIEQAASGLHYAHSFKDKISGEALSIVHRDISPQNLLLSYEGSVKVIDFGIAKASTNIEATRAGVIKGKPSYLSPEQINGDTLDGRSDLFSLGTVLWELLVGKKLFAGENDLAILKQIESCQTHVKPPSTINPEVPPELDYIVLKSLAKQRDKRYQTAEELQRALHKFLYMHSPDFNPSDLSYYAKDLFKKEIVEDRKRIQRLNDEVEKLMVAPPLPPIPIVPTHTEAIPDLIVNLTAPEDEPVAQVAKQEATTVVHKAPSIPLPAAEPAAAAMNTQIVQAAKSRAGSGAVTPMPSAKPTTASIGAFQPTYAQSGVIDSARRGRTSSVAMQNPHADKSGSWVGKLLMTGLAAGAGLFFFGKDLIPGFPNYASWTGGTNPAAPAATDRAIASNNNETAPAPQTPAPASVAPQGPGSVAKPGDHTIQLRLNISPGGGTVAIAVGTPSVEANGKRVSADNPVILVPMDQTVEVIAERNGYKRFRSEFFIDSREVGSMKEWSKDIAMEPNRFGYLSVHTTPSADAIIMIDEGKPWVKKTPFENEKIPVGTYNIRFVNELLGMEKKVTVKIDDDKVVNLDERLEIKD